MLRPLIFMLGFGALLLGTIIPGATQDRCYVHDKSGNVTQILQANFMSDPLNCGSCGNRCSAAMPLCKAGTCSACVPQMDQDCDGIDNSVDNCKFVSNTSQDDADTDGVGNACDNCPTVSNPDQFNTDGAADGGDACDPDDDNDFCLDGQDDKPTQDSSIVGWRIAVPSTLCAQAVRDVYGWDGSDPDSDSLRNCMDPDDDNDGLFDADDPCPIDPGVDLLQCQARPIFCPVTTILNVCLLGGCNEFVIRIVSVINPGLIIQNFTIRQGSILVLYPSAEQSLEVLSDAVLDQSATGAKRSSSKIRLEIWSKDHRGQPGRLIAKGAKYSPQKVSRLKRTGGSVLLLTLAENGAVKSIHEAAVPPPASVEAYLDAIQRTRTKERPLPSKRNY